MSKKKRCAHCRFPLSVKEFTKNIRNHDGLSSSCKMCSKDIQGERVRRKKDARKSGKGTTSVGLW